MELEEKLRREVAREIAAFKAQQKPHKPNPAQCGKFQRKGVSTANLAPPSIKERAHCETNPGSVILAVGYVANTHPGSLYSTLLRVLAAHGHLALHAHLFEQFRCEQTPAAAKKLLRKIGVVRLGLDQAVRADELFREHCQKRTQRLADRAAKGDLKAISIRNTPEICDKRGQWHGDIEEALDILYGARSPNLTGTRKNTNILRHVKLCFDRSTRGAEQFCFLYPAKCYRLFQRARALAAE